MKMSELEKLPLGTYLSVQGLAMWGEKEGEPVQLVGSLKSVWRTRPRSGQATIVCPYGKEWHVREKRLDIADDSQRALFDRLSEADVKRREECDRIAALLGVEPVEVQEWQYVTLTWDQVLAIAGRLEKAGVQS